VYLFDAPSGASPFDLLQSELLRWCREAYERIHQMRADQPCNEIWKSSGHWKTPSKAWFPLPSWLSVIPAPPLSVPSPGWDVPSLWSQVLSTLGWIPGSPSRNFSSSWTWRDCSSLLLLWLLQTQPTQFPHLSLLSKPIACPPWFALCTNQPQPTQATWFIASAMAVIYAVSS